MHQALRPYVTTGVALVGASVIAAAPIIPTPTDIQVPNPVAQVERGVQLTAAQQQFIEDSINTLIFNFVARPTVAGAQVLGRVLTPLIGEEQAALLPIAALGLAGPLISGGGSIGTGLQDLVDSGNLKDALINLIGLPGTITDGFVNGGYGPDLASLVAPLLFPTLPAALWPEVLAGGLISDQIIDGIITPGGFLPTFVQLPGTIPTVQSLVEQLFGLLSPAAAFSATGASAQLAAPASDTTVEDAVNSAVFALTKVTLSIVELGAPLVAPILGVSKEEAAGFLALGAVGLLGPLISGTGSVGTALQDVINSDGLVDLVNNLIGAPATVIDGAVNGGYGPNLAPLIGDFIPNPTPFPVIDVRAGGFINEADIGPIFNPPSPIPVGLGGTFQGTIPTLQGLVEQLFGLLPSASSFSTLQAPTGQQQLKTSGTDGGIQTNLAQGGTDEGQGQEGPDVTPKKHRQRVELNVLKFNPLDPRGKKGDTTDVSDSDGKSDSGAAAHRLGDGKIGSVSVRDVIKRVTGQSHEKESAPAE